MSWIKIPLRNATIAVALFVMASACTHVEYRPTSAPKNNGGTPFERVVNYQVQPQYYRTPPRCVAVLPSSLAHSDSLRARIIETAFARQLSFRVSRVIGPYETAQMARKMAVDLDTASGRRRFGILARCDTAVDISSKGFETTFVLVWAQANLSLSARLFRLRDDVELWHGTHAANRSEGSIPLSPISIPVSAFSAGKFHSDQDVFPSMADDAARRLLASLPDVSAALFRRTDGR